MFTGAMNRCPSLCTVHINRGLAASSPSCRRSVFTHCVSASSVTGTPRHTSSRKRSLETSLPCSRISNAKASKYRPLSSTGSPPRFSWRSSGSSTNCSKTKLPAIFQRNLILCSCRSPPLQAHHTRSHAWRDTNGNRRTDDETRRRKPLDLIPVGRGRAAPVGSVRRHAVHERGQLDRARFLPDGSATRGRLRDCRAGGAPRHQYRVQARRDRRERGRLTDRLGQSGGGTRAYSLRLSLLSCAADRSRRLGDRQASA